MMDRIEDIAQILGLTPDQVMATFSTRTSPLGYLEQIAGLFDEDERLDLADEIASNAGHRIGSIDEATPSAFDFFDQISGSIYASYLDRFGILDASGQPYIYLEAFDAEPEVDAGLVWAAGEYDNPLICAAHLCRLALEADHHSLAA